MADPSVYDPLHSPQLKTPTEIGRAADRVDGPMKVRGLARYTYDIRTPSPATYGVIVPAAIPRGRISNIDTAAAEAVPGVVLVMTHRNAPTQAPFGPAVADSRNTRARPVLGDDQVRYRGAPVALVVAETLEVARSAALLVQVRYVPEPFTADFTGRLGLGYAPAVAGPGLPPDTALGDFEPAFAAAPARLDVTYANACQNHNPIEPHAALAIWEPDLLTVYASQQAIAPAHQALAATLQLPPDRIRVVSRFVGGGFGSKLRINPEVVLAALAALTLRRPVKVAQTRQQMFANTGLRPAVSQRIRLGAHADGRLSAIAHEATSQTSPHDEFAEASAAFTRGFYAAPNRLTRHRVVAVDLPAGETMRAPGEASGLLAFECAMDELAVALELDPVTLRIRNDARRDPERGTPFASRRLVECLEIGARRFRWSERPAQPASRRDGQWLIGYGMAAGVRGNKLGKSSARVGLGADGRATAQLDMTDIGTGSYTILSQIVAEVLGLPIDKVTIALGDSQFPVTTGSGGSLGAGSAGSALFNACVALKGAIAAAAVGDPRSALHGGVGSDAVLREEKILLGHKSERLQALAARHGGFAVEASVAPGDTYQQFSQQAFGAYFAEVGVDADTAEIRVRRMLGVFDVGRVLNAKTARSQLVGGMIWGLGAALQEESLVDPRFGQVTNRDLAGYHLPAHADIPDIDVVTLDGDDPLSNPLGSKGIGELGICGSGAAVANAVFNATGVRVRSFPITLDKLLPHMD